MTLETFPQDKTDRRPTIPEIFEATTDTKLALARAKHHYPDIEIREMARQVRGRGE